MARPRLIYEARAETLLELAGGGSICNGCSTAGGGNTGGSSSGGSMGAGTTGVGLDNLPSSFLHFLASLGVDALYILGAWTRSPTALQHSQGQLPASQRELAVASPFAVRDYAVAPSLGGNAAMRALRARCNALGIRVVLDFVANHVARDHFAVALFPHLLEQAASSAEARSSGRYFATVDGPPDVLFAFGRDRFGNCFGDTAQLSLRSPRTRQCLLHSLLAIAQSGICDGLRIDMAAHLAPAVVAATWGQPLPQVPVPPPQALAAPPPAGEPPSPPLLASGAEAPAFLAEALARLGPAAASVALASASDPCASFWTPAAHAIKALRPDFFLAGEHFDGGGAAFDVCSDRDLALALCTGGAESVLQQLRATAVAPGAGRRLAFVESHETPRAAAHRGGERGAAAAAVLAFVAPSATRLINDGQLSGRALSHSVLLGVRPPEAASFHAVAFYTQLIGLVMHEPALLAGIGHLALVTPSRDGNASWRSVVAIFVSPAPPPPPATADGAELGRHLARTSSTSSSIGAGSIGAATVNSTSSALLSAAAGGSGVTAVAHSASTSSSSSSTAGVSDFKALVPPPAAVASEPVAATATATTASAAACSLAPVGNTFLILANMSSSHANGHVLFARADDSAYAHADTTASAARVAALCTSDGASIVAFIDRLAVQPQLQPQPPLLRTCAALGSEGLWLALEPWQARVLQLVPPGAQLLHSE